MIDAAELSCCKDVMATTAVGAVTFVFSDATAELDEE